jgi:hypothetical protein
MNLRRCVLIVGVGVLMALLSQAAGEGKGD